MSNINKPLVERLNQYNETAQYKDVSLKRNPSIISYSLTAQKKELVYLQCGNYSIGSTTHGLSDNSDIHNNFRECFSEGAISPETYDKCYADIHEDLHIAYFIDLLKKRAAEKGDLKFTRQPNRRVNPTFLVLNGLAGREDLEELITSISPKHIFAVENDIELVHDFLSYYSIEDIRDFCKSHGNISFSLSVGCGAPEEHINEVKAWIAANNELGTEGLLISSSPTPSIKKESMRAFLTTNTWHVDSINNMGYQVDEYNMLANTSANFNSLKHKIFLSPFSEKDTIKDLPVVITGSGPSLDTLIPFLVENRDKFILVSGGSSISTLLDAGIKPDIHAQLERSEHQFKLHSELSQKYDLSDILLIASSTVPERHQSLFDRIIYFFRPALSPLALYASNDGEILNAEGPDTINSAVASISALGFKRIALFGVDCGSSSKSSIRSKGAFGGYIPRKLNKVERGCKGVSIFTNHRLQTVRNAVNWSLLLNKAKATNFSNGLAIPSASSQDIESFKDWLTLDISNDSPFLAKRDLLKDLLWDHMISLNQYRLTTSWQIANPRQKVFDFCRELEFIFENSSDIRDIVFNIRKMISLTVKRPTKSHQLVPRITRGTLGIICPMILSFYNSAVTDDPNAEVLPFIKSVLLEFVDLLESDLYSVIDRIEPHV